MTSERSWIPFEDKAVIVSLVEFRIASITIPSTQSSFITLLSINMACLRCTHCHGPRFFSDLPPSHCALPFYWYEVEGSNYSVALVRRWYEYGLPVDASLPEIFLRVSGELVGVYDHAALRSFWFGPFGAVFGCGPSTPSASSAPQFFVFDVNPSNGSVLAGAASSSDSSSDATAPSVPEDEFRLGPRPSTPPPRVSTSSVRRSVRLRPPPPAPVVLAGARVPSGPGRTARRRQY